ncbi:MAG: serine--tRNA ligase [Nanoarchaeota archaeon]|nr:serine--tRNA ligase [Nanoarchaeota archaeon]MBU4124441.1 serine--tRNA ligase [Nanoarchaeota archaeon]
MLDIKFIRENVDLVKENIKKKFKNELLEMVDDIIEKDEEYRIFLQQAEKLRYERNEVSQQISELKKKGKDATELMMQAKNIPEQIFQIEKKSLLLKTDILDIQKRIPNIIHSSVPIGKDASDNVEIKKIGKPIVPKYEIFNHAELAERLGGADFETARETSGKGFYFLKGDLARLSVAMNAFARDYMIKQGFEYMEPPFMIRRKVVEGVMSFAERDAMMYKIEGEDLYLIGTSEHPLIGLFMDKTLNKKDLPFKITGFSTCFRKEVGAHGLEERGFYRVHQFNKQEMIIICEPEDSYKWYDKMLKYTIDVFKALNVPIRIFESCSGDLADLKAKGCDVEAWSPRQKKYYEVGSLTNMEEAQARRLNIKISGKDGKYYAHTLNNTVVATPRALIAVMENNQNKDGSINIPKVLQPYMGGLKKISKK